MRGLFEPEVLELLDAAAPARQNALDAIVSRRLGADVASLPVGRRDAALARLRIGSFGRSAQIRASCRDCDEELEAELDLERLPLARDVPAEVSVLVDGESIRARMPTVDDLAAVANAADPRRALMDRLLTREISAPGLAAIEDALEAADPMIDVSIEMHCPSCHLATVARLDIASMLWSEIETYGRRLTLEVHWLASRYGWTERDVLALSPNRRRAYLELDAP